GDRRVLHDLHPLLDRGDGVGRVDGGRAVDDVGGTVGEEEGAERIQCGVGLVSAADETVHLHAVHDGAVHLGGGRDELVNRLRRGDAGRLPAVLAVGGGGRSDEARCVL